MQLKPLTSHVQKNTSHGMRYCTNWTTTSTTRTSHDDIEKFVQAAMLVGHEIDPIKYFKGSNAFWDGESRVKVINVASNGENDCYGHGLVLLQVSYKRLCLNVVKSTIEVHQILY